MLRGSPKAPTVDKEIFKLIGPSCPLQIGPLQNNAMDNNLSATAGNTAGNDFLGSHVGRQVRVHECQKHHGHGALVAPLS